MHLRARILDDILNVLTCFHVWAFFATFATEQTLRRAKRPITQVAILQIRCACALKYFYDHCTVFYHPMQIYVVFNAKCCLPINHLVYKYELLLATWEQIRWYRDFILY
jgi:hypothetical protein